MTQFFNKFKKPCFWPIFPIYGGKKDFPGKSGSVTHNFIRVSSTMPNSKKMPGQTEGWKDRQTLFYRTLLASAREPKRFFYKN